MPLSKIQFTPGINREVTQYTNSGGWWDCDKIRFRAGHPEVIGGWSKVENATVPGVTRSMHEWSLLNGTLNLGLGTNSNLQILSNDTYFDITPTSFTPGPVDASLSAGWGVGKFGQGTWGNSVQIPSFGPSYQDPLIWHLDNFGQNFVANPRGQAIYYWDASLTNPYTLPAVKLDTLADGYCPTTASGVFVHPLAQNVVALGCTKLPASAFAVTATDPMQIRWSDLANPLVWSPQRTNSAGGQRLQSGSRIIGFLNTFSETLIWTDTTLYGMRYTGDNYVYAFNLLSDGCSIIGPNASASNGSTTFWMDRNCFAVYNGSVSELPCTLKSYVFSNMNRAQSFKCYAAHHRSFSEIWWFYPSLNSNEIDSYVIYNYMDNIWSKGTMPRTAWLDTGRLPTPLAISPAGSLYFHESGLSADGSPINAYIESADLDLRGGDQLMFLSRIIPDVQFLGPTANQNMFVDILKRGTSGSPKIVERSMPIAPSTRNIFTRTRGRRLSVRFRSNDAYTSWRLGTTELSIAGDGQR